MDQAHVGSVFIIARPISLPDHAHLGGWVITNLGHRCGQCLHHCPPHLPTKPRPPGRLGHHKPRPQTWAVSSSLSVPSPYQTTPTWEVGSSQTQTTDVGSVFIIVRPISLPNHAHLGGWVITNLGHRYGQCLHHCPSHLPTKPRPPGRLGHHKPRPQMWTVSSSLSVPSPYQTTPTWEVGSSQT